MINYQFNWSISRFCNINQNLVVSTIEIEYWVGVESESATLTMNGNPENQIKSYQLPPL